MNMLHHQINKIKNNCSIKYCIYDESIFDWDFLLLVILIGWLLIRLVLAVLLFGQPIEPESCTAWLRWPRRVPSLFAARSAEFAPFVWLKIGPSSQSTSEPARSACAHSSRCRCRRAPCRSRSTCPARRASRSTVPESLCSPRPTWAARETARS